MTQSTSTQTREAYLERAVAALRPRFAAVGAPLPERLHVSVGFAYGARQENSRIYGECWSRRASDDGVNHLFISPELDDTAAVLGTLAHELIHAADDNASGHRGRFVEIAKALGMCGPVGHERKYAYAVPGVVFAAELIALAETLGDYPHGRLNPKTADVPVTPAGTTVTVVPRGPRVRSGPRRQTTRHIKVSCQICGYAVRTTRAWLDKGAPICPTDLVPMSE